MGPLKEVKVGLCGACMGTGLISTDETVDYHRNISISFSTKCKRCEGSGRMVTTIVTSYAPFVPGTEISKEEAERNYYDNR